MDFSAPWTRERYVQLEWDKIRRKEIGKAIKQKREKYKITQYQVADEVGVSQPVICQIERGTAGYTIDPDRFSQIMSAIEKLHECDS